MWDEGRCEMWEDVIFGSGERKEVRLQITMDVIQECTDVAHIIDI